MPMMSELLELASVALACRDPDTLLKTLSSRARTALDARAALVWLNNPQTHKLVCRATWSDLGEARLLTHPNGGGKIGILEEVCKSEKSKRLCPSDLGNAKLIHLNDDYRAHLTSALYVPLAATHGANGVIEILNKRTGVFTDEDVQFLEAAGRLAVQAIKNLQALEEGRETQLAALERLTARSMTLAAHLHPRLNSGSFSRWWHVKFATSLAPTLATFGCYVPIPRTFTWRRSVEKAPRGTTARGSPAPKDCWRKSCNKPVPGSCPTLRPKHILRNF